MKKFIAVIVTVWNTLFVSVLAGYLEYDIVKEMSYQGFGTPLFWGVVTGVLLGSVSGYMTWQFGKIFR